jgi:hypothetical protein
MVDYVIKAIKIASLKESGTHLQQKVNRAIKVSYKDHIRNTSHSQLLHMKDKSQNEKLLMRKRVGQGNSIEETPIATERGSNNSANQDVDSLGEDLHLAAVAPNLNEHPSTLEPQPIQLSYNQLGFNTQGSSLQAEPNPDF